MHSKFLKQMKEGILTNNPTFVQLLGMCPTLAVTTSVINAIGMGTAVTFVLICSNLFISLVRNLIPKEVRIASYIVIISGFVTAVELLIKAYFPAIDASLGLFIPLIVVNCIILARAEAFASKNKPVPSMVDGLSIGLGFTLALVAISAVRELLGSGKLFAATDGTGGIQILGDWFSPATIFLLPCGAFLTLGFLIALVQKIGNMSSERKRRQALEIDAIENGYHPTLVKDPVTGEIVRKNEARAAETEFLPEESAQLTDEVPAINIVETGKEDADA
ncbi:MAG: electron transport complex subunit E [Clostridia bacterium]|nr:electron transport complex subunit E [Clostridia bacterium]